MKTKRGISQIFLFVLLHCYTPYNMEVFKYTYTQKKKKTNNLFKSKIIKYLLEVFFAFMDENVIKKNRLQKWHKIH